MNTKTLIAASLAALTIVAAPVAHATGPVCNAMGRYAELVAEGRDLGQTKDDVLETHMKTRAKLAVTGDDKPDPKADAVRGEILRLVYDEPRTKDFTPADFRLAGERVCAKKFGPNY